MIDQLKALVVSLYRFFIPVVTYEWCLSSGIGCKLWQVEWKKCKNGTPVGSGWFITYIKFGPSLLDYAECLEFVDES